MYRGDAVYYSENLKEKREEKEEEEKTTGQTNTREMKTSIDGDAIKSPKRTA